MKKIANRIGQKVRGGADGFGSWLATPKGQTFRWSVTTVLAVIAVAAGCGGR
ncbi:hypothetical protein ACODT3_01125 [Streptomyces sp. 4.24]|uniref:hypothetical protein n=1 Tax=Streptomyces tritrimontium TaxID=3406573 RepID=UPI003BB4D845